MKNQINYLDEAARFIASRSRRRESVLAPFIPAIQLMLKSQLSYKEIFEFVNSHGAACAYPTVVAFTKRYAGVIKPRRPKINATSSIASHASFQSEKNRASEVKTPIDAKCQTHTRQRDQDAVSSPDTCDMSHKLARSRQTADRLVGKSARELIEQAEKL